MARIMPKMFFMSDVEYLHVFSFFIFAGVWYPQCLHLYYSDHAFLLWGILDAAAFLLWGNLDVAAFLLWGILDVAAFLLWGILDVTAVNTSFPDTGDYYQLNYSRTCKNNIIHPHDIWMWFWQVTGLNTNWHWTLMHQLPDWAYAQMQAGEKNC